MKKLLDWQSKQIVNIFDKANLRPKYEDPKPKFPTIVNSRQKKNSVSGLPS